MPPTATLEDIKAYQEQVEKNKIIPDNLPPCLRCDVDSAFFKPHAYRERKFLIINKMIIQEVLSPLLRFKCPGCGKTYTVYPDFAIPYKRYTRQSIMHFSAAYVESARATYEQTIRIDRSLPGYPDNTRTLAGSTVHRWITTLSGFVESQRKALALILQAFPVSNICRELAVWTVSPSKYRSQSRRHQILKCRRFVMTEAAFQIRFNRSIFTKLAIGCRFG